MSANSTNIAIRLVLAVSAMLLVAPCSMAQNTADTASAITVDGKEKHLSGGGCTNRARRKRDQPQGNHIRAPR